MKNIFLVIIFILSIKTFSQLEEGQVFTIPNVTEINMNALNPNEGSVVYNTDDDGIYKYNGTVWTKIDNSLQALVLNSDSGGPTMGAETIIANDNYNDFPLDGGDVQTIDNNIFQINGDGEIEVLEDGVYFITAGLSSDNSFPEDDYIKYAIAAFLNNETGGINQNDLIGFFTRGYVDIPAQGGDNEYWGGSGTLIYLLEANDVINVRYRFDVPDGNTTFTSWLINIGITKIQ